MMEVNRKANSEDSQNTIRMQRQQIFKLKKDNDRLKEDLALETRQAKQANNQSASVQIAKLQDQADMYARKIEVEKRRIEQQDNEIAKMKDTIFDQRKEMGGINASHDKNEQVTKQIRTLENRLDKALVKFNEALAHNHTLRENIDNLRRERVVFDGIYRKLERELHEKKNKMAQIIEVSNASYEARDRAQSEMVQLKTQADREQTKFEVEWSQLGQLIEEDRKLKEFQKNKDREKITMNRTDPSMEEEDKLRKKVNKGSWSIAKDKADIHLSMEKVQSYEEAFAKIQKATKITDIDELVQTFINAEDNNFKLFNYVNDLANKIEKLEEEIGSVTNDIKKYEGHGVSADNQRKKIITSLQSKLSKTEKTAGYYEGRYADARHTCESLKEGIQKIFDKVGCDDPVMKETLGNAGVTEANMMLFLGLIEQRTNDLVLLFKKQQVRDGVENNNDGLEAEQTRMAIPPTMESYSEDEEGEGDNEDVPVDVDQMRAEAYD